MGGNLALNIIDHGHDVVVYNRSAEKMVPYVEKGAIAGASLEELVGSLEAPRMIWVMVTAGDAVDHVIAELTPLLDDGDTIIDGGNSFYKDTIRRAENLKEEGINLLDIGTSGGIDGARNGACFMVGGDEERFNAIEPLLADISVDGGYGYFGKSGAGHFVKMIHNGIEYGMMQSIGEGFEVMEKSAFDIDMSSAAKVWSNGSVIRGWLMDLAEEAYSEDPSLEKYSGAIGLSGEGEWSIATAKELEVPVPAMDSSVDMRIKSKESPRYQGKVIQALRFGFGRHEQPS